MNSTKMVVSALITLAIINPICRAAEPSGGQADWQGLTLSQFADVAIDKACSPEAARNKGLDPAFVQYAWDHYLTQADALKTAAPDSVFKLISAVLAKLPKERKGEFAKLYYQVVLQGQDPSKVDGPRLILVGWGLIASAMYQQDQSFPEFAKAVAAHVKDRERFEDDVKTLQGGSVVDPKFSSAAVGYLSPFWYEEMRETLDDNACPFYRSLFSDSDVMRDFAACYFFGKALGSDADRQLLRDELIKTECGCPRMGPAKTLTWSYKRVDQLDKWQNFIDGKLKDPSLGVEARDRWMLVRAYAEEAKPYNPSPLDGRPWIEKALASASDQTLEKECTETLATGYLLTNQFTKGHSFLHQEAARTTSPDLQQTIRQLDEALAKEQVKAEADQKARDAVAESQRLGGEVAALRTRVQQAKARGETTAQVTSLETALALVQHQLDTAKAATQPSPPAQ